MKDNNIYELDIPKDMVLIVPSKTRELNHRRVEISDDNELVTVINPIEDKTDYHHVKKIWLKPIEKDEFEEWFTEKLCKSLYHEDKALIIKKYCESCHEWTKENERKKYQSLIDWAINKLKDKYESYDVGLSRILKDLKIEWRK